MSRTYPHSALRFFQEWTKRTSREVLAARSQFSLGIGLLNATINDEPPDSRFFSCGGRFQWVRLLAADTLLLLRGDVQLADRALVPLEQIGLGGQDTIRGYRQDVLLTDNGAFGFSRASRTRSPSTEAEHSGTACSFY
jgi:hemolysin activation/secretion protein